MVGAEESPSQTRYHIVLIPGFGGFDALGTVEYYAGITPLFNEWKKEANKPVVLHYFDNLPSAAVVTRAERLRRYLAKRFARGEILPNDEIALVGHSTGGLDIRQLVYELHAPGNDTVRVDSGRPVEFQALRQCVHRVVFLSVPHWGTNIADWVHARSVVRKPMMEIGRAAAFAGSHVYLIDQIEKWIAGSAACLTQADLLLAVQDAIAEVNEHNGQRSPTRTAEAHEAYSELALYGRHMASDFHAIDDLTSEPPASGPQSPAHFNPHQRAEELKRWHKKPIESLSYVTIAPSPFDFAKGYPAPVWNLTNPLSYPEILLGCQRGQCTDIAYRVCYRACAGGPFRYAAQCVKVLRDLNGVPKNPMKIELWDNDGIVNTLSMLWPEGDNVLVTGDHLDLVGHYKLAEADPDEGRNYGGYNALQSVSQLSHALLKELYKWVKGDPDGGRQYRSYDALKSGSQFREETFKKIWTDIFKFCVDEKSNLSASPASL